MITWIDRLLRRPGVTPATVATMRRVPLPLGQPPLDEPLLDKKKRLRNRMASNLPNLPPSPLRNITVTIIEALDAEIAQLEKPADADHRHDQA